MSAEQKVVVITGASQGIGAELRGVGNHTAGPPFGQCPASSGTRRVRGGATCELSLTR
jgi:hypothetical protein